MTPKGADLDATDLIEVSTIVGGSYVTKSITGQELIDAIPLPPSGLTVGTTPISSGTNGRVLFQGTGNVLQQSSSLFWDSTNNRLGIGTSTPFWGLHYNTDGGLNVGMFSSFGNTNTFESLLYLLKGRGTQASPSAVLSGDNLGSLRIAGQYSSIVGQYTTGAKIEGVATENWSLSANGTYLGFHTTTTGTASVVERMRIFANGNIGINTTTDAGFRLDVNGTARVQGSTTIAASSNFGLNITRSGTSGIAEQIYNSAGTTYLGADSSAGAFLFTNGLPYASFFGNGANYPTQFGTNGAIRMTIFAGGNVGINTTTDAGFKLDVNGTARVSGNFQANANVIFGTSNGFYWDSATQRLGLGTNSPQVVFHIQTGTSEKLRLETSGTIGNFVTFYNSGVRKGYLGRSSSNDDLVYFNEAATGNLIFGSNGTERMRIKSNGVINMSAIPTSSAGLSSGDVWNDGGTLKIV